jgi:hypothetical protein
MKSFLTKYECFTINSHDWVIIDISPNTEYEIIVSIKRTNCLCYRIRAIQTRIVLPKN